jgi:hypothetical protein
MKEIDSSGLHHWSILSVYSVLVSAVIPCIQHLSKSNISEIWDHMSVPVWKQWLCSPHPPEHALSSVSFSDMAWESSRHHGQQFQGQLEPLLLSLFLPVYWMRWQCRGFLYVWQNHIVFPKSFPQNVGKPQAQLAKTPCNQDPRKSCFQRKRPSGSWHLLEIVEGRCPETGEAGEWSSSCRLGALFCPPPASESWWPAFALQIPC